MTLSDLASLGSFVSGVAVLISLIFLYFQLRQMSEQVRQAEKNQQASIRQARAARTVEMQINATDPLVADAVLKAVTGAPDITATQVFQFGRYCGATFINNEDVFYQRQQGLLSDSDFAVFASRVAQELSHPAFRAQWKRARRFYGAEFADFVDGLIAQPPVELISADPAEWLRFLAAERSAASRPL